MSKKIGLEDLLGMDLKGDETITINAKELATIVKEREELRSFKKVTLSLTTIENEYHSNDFLCSMETNTKALVNTTWLRKVLVDFNLLKMEAEKVERKLSKIVDKLDTANLKIDVLKTVKTKPLKHYILRDSLLDVNA